MGRYAPPRDPTDDIARQTNGHSVNTTARFLIAGTLFAFSGFAWAGPDTEAIPALQAAADVLREAGGADAAFLPAGMVRTSWSSDNLASVLRYPTDELAVVKLRGSQLRAALERSVSLFPSPNDSFLQISNLDVTFSRTAPADSRIKSARIGGGAIDDARSYSVAMPATLARGGLGYFKVWDKSQIERIVAGVTLETILRGKHAYDSAPRWQPS